MKFLGAIVIVAFIMLLGGSANAAPSASNQNTQAYFTIKGDMLPKAKFSDYAHYAGLPRRYNTGGERAFVFSPRDREWAAYDASGYKVSGGIANGGKAGHRTPAGVYRVYNKAGPGHVSSKYPRPNGGAPMPYDMHFTKAGHAVHGSPYISNRNSSHGCIRVKTNAAKWLNHYIMKNGTKVIVTSY